MYSQALTVFMICSRREWADIALNQLRQCFEAQDYPSSIIDVQFERVLQLNRKDLIFNVKTVKPNATQYKRGLLVTYHKNNPPFKQWIDKAAKETLHADSVCKELFTKIPVITRQPRNVKQICVKSRHWKHTTTAQAGVGEKPGWNIIFRHAKKCQTCERMSNTNTFYCHVTRRTYTIRSRFTFQCDTTWCIYYAVCSEHPEAAYVGQTFSAKAPTSRGGLYKRHCGHRRQCATGDGGLGAHYHEFHGGSTDTMKITIIDSVAPGQHDRLDFKEEFWIYQLRTMATMGFGGLHQREEMERKTRYNCEYVECKKRPRQPGV